MVFVRPQLPSAAIIVAIGAAAATIRFLHLCPSHSPSHKSISTKSCPSTGSSTMDSSGSSLLVLCSKSPEDNEFLQSLKSTCKTLKLLGGEENEEIRVLLDSAMGSTNQPTFQTQLYMKALSTTNFGKFLIWSPRLPSIHDLVTLNFCEIPVGSVCVADVQFKGRGIGLNVDNEQPTTCLNAVLQDISSGSHQLMWEDILAAFFNNFEELFEVFMNKGFQDLEELYYKTWLHSGQKVVIEENHEGQSAADIVSVTIQGLTFFRVFIGY